MYISKTLTDLCVIKKNKNKKIFCKYCLQCFSIEKVLIEHKENYLTLYRGKNAVHRFIEAILKEYNYCKKKDNKK